MAFAGTDSKGQIYATSNQILKLTQYSVAGLYANTVRIVQARFNSSASTSSSYGYLN